MEEAGTGVDKITRGWFDQFLSVPDLSEDKLSMNVTWILPYTAMLSKVDMAAQRAYLGHEKYASLSAIEKIILLLVPGDRYVSNSDLRKYVPKLHAVDLGRVLSRLRDAGYLESKGRSNAMKYTLSASLAKFMKEGQSPEDVSPNGVIGSVLNGGGNTVLNSGSSVLNGGGNTVLNSGSCTNKVDKARFAFPPDVYSIIHQLNIPLELRDLLYRYREKCRHTRQETDDIVMKLCQERYLTISQLSILLDRGLAALRRDCIAALVRHGKLKHKEEKITHKNQAYTSTEVYGDIE